MEATIASNILFFYFLGIGILQKYSSLQEALLTLFPNAEWEIWLFKEQVPTGFWQKDENIRYAGNLVLNLVISEVLYATNKLKIKDLDEWCLVPKNQVIVFQFS
jgi:hypothetical protein